MLGTGFVLLPFSALFFAIPSLSHPGGHVSLFVLASGIVLVLAGSMMMVTVRRLVRTTLSVAGLILAMSLVGCGVASDPVLPGSQPTSIVSSAQSTSTTDDSPQPALYPIKVDGLYGFIDATGRVVIKPQYSDVRDFTEGVAPVQVSRRCGYIDHTGTFAIAATFVQGGRFKGGLAAVMDQDGDWGYIDKTGRYVIKPQFTEAHDFSERLAAVEKGGRWGFIDTTGRFVISPRFTDADNFGEGMAPAVKGDLETGLWGYVDRTGSWVIEPSYGDALPFSPGLAAAITDQSSLAPAVGTNGWGYIDKTGKFVIQPQFTSADPFAGSLAKVTFPDEGTTKGKEAYIDTSGKVVWMQP